MITKGIIEGVNLENYSVKVRLPVFDKIANDPNATPYDALPPATICVPKGQYPQFNIGDIVFVGFENNNRSNPIILGMLFKNNMGKEIVKSIAQTLKVTDEANLPETTKVGETDIQSLAYPVGSIYENIDPLFDVEGTFGGKWLSSTLNTPSTYSKYIDQLNYYYLSNFNIVNVIDVTTGNSSAYTLKSGTNNIVADKFYCVRVTVDVNGQPMFYNKTVKCTQFRSPWNSDELGIPLEDLTFNLNGITYHSYILQQGTGLKLEMNGYNKTTGWPGTGLNYASCRVTVSIFNITDALSSLRNSGKYISIAESNLNQYTLRCATALDPVSCGESLLGGNFNYATFRVSLNSNTWLVAFYEKAENQTVSIFIVPVEPSTQSVNILIDSINSHDYWRRIE